jgi:hypothetical protein
MNNSQAGKGDKPRPVNKVKYNSNYDEIDWNKSSLNSVVKEVKVIKNKKNYRY